MSNLEAALQTDCVTGSDIKEVVKKQLKDAPKRKGGEKNENDQDRTNTTNVNWNLNCIVGVIFTTILLLGHYEFIFN